MSHSVAKRTPSTAIQLTFQLTPVVARDIHRHQAIVFAMWIRLERADKDISAIRRGDFIEFCDQGIRKMEWKGHGERNGSVRRTPDIDALWVRLKRIRTERAVNLWNPLTSLLF